MHQPRLIFYQNQPLILIFSAVFLSGIMNTYSQIHTNHCKKNISCSIENLKFYIKFKSMMSNNYEIFLILYNLLIIF